MNLSNSQLDQLFENVRKEEPVASYEETKRAFLAATIASVGGVLATKSLLKLFTFKQWIMMISVLSAATIGTLLVTMSATPNEKKTSVETGNESPNLEIQTEAISNERPGTQQATLKTIEADFVYPELSVEQEVCEIVTQFGQPPVRVKAYLKSDGSYHFEYVIGPETTESDLKKLQKKAKGAGFELKYEPTFTDGKLQKLSLHIVQVKENGQKQNIQISDIDLEDNKTYKVAWNVDDKGTATTIACGEDFNSEEFDEMMAQLDLEKLTAELEAIEFKDITKELEDLEKVLQDELVMAEVYRIKELANLEELLEEGAILSDAQVRESLMEIEELNDGVLEELQASLEEARIALAEEHEQFKVECEALQKECEKMELKCKEGHQKILNELENDGLIKDRSKKVKMHASKGKLSVNGKEIPKNLRDKYEGLVKEYFDVDVSNKEMNWTWVHDDK